MSHLPADFFSTFWERRGFLAYIDHWVEHIGTAPAVSFSQTTFSYHSLANNAQVLATALASRGVSAGAKVGVAVSRSEMLVPLLLAIWSLRAAYVPIDPSYPANRQAYILENAEADVLVVDEPRDDFAFAGTMVTLRELRSAPVPDVVRPLAAATYDPADMAYMIYTSGSTGNPKGVAITHGNLINFLLAMAEEPGLCSDDVLLAITTISFDIHILELFLPLLVGAHVIVASKQEAVTPEVLQHLVEERGVTVLQATPATWRMVLGHGWRPHRPLKKILVGGEALPTDLRPLMHAVSTELWNMYGPTETTVWSTCQLIREDDSKIFIGRPIRNTTVHFVDDKLEPVADGTAGELLIGGAGVAMGYYRNPDLTAEKFIVNPRLESGRVYRTGDAVIRRDGGVLEYVNRIDNQIKIRGFRIEPSEIEHVLAQHPQIKQAAVVAADFHAGDKRMLAFYLGEESTAAELQRFCSERLPVHMVPHHFIWLSEFPMTANYKVDRKSLAATGKDRINGQKEKRESDARDDLDRSLLAVWEKALVVKGISIDDNFFELGGHSLLALQVISDMHKATGLTFSSSLFFESPTLRALRDSLGEQANRAASVVKLNNATEGEPVFCLCGVQIYRHLAAQFNNGRPVFGVFAEKEFAIIEATEQLRYSFNSLVQSYVDAIRRQGTYSSLTLVGLSFGGLVALEAADILRKEGVRISNVILLDSYLSTSGYRSIRKLLADIRQSFQREGLISLQRVMRRGLQKLKQVGGGGELPPDMTQVRKGREKAFDRAAVQFEASDHHYAFDVLLVKATRTNFGFGLKAKRDYDLKSIIRGKLRIREVDADHVAMMTGDAVTQVYEVIRQYEQRRA
jgi:amino acid adenylation domain